MSLYWKVPLLVAGGLGVFLCVLRYRKSKSWGYYDYKKHDLSGKTFVITGCNTGLGLEAAKILASLKANIIMVCRSLKRGQEAAKAVKAQAKGGGEISVMEMDLSSLSSVRSFVNDFKSLDTKIDCLILNAGVWIPMDRQLKTEDGFEIHFGVNHLSHFLLTKLLMDAACLSKQDSRIVVVSSSLMNYGQLDLDKLDFVHDGRVPSKDRNSSFAPTGYVDTKLMNGLFSKELAKKLEASNENCTVYTTCPGFCKTDLSRESMKDFSFLSKVFFLPILMVVMRSAWRGSLNIIKVALAPKSSLSNGGFYKECQLAQSENVKLDAMTKQAQELWQLSEKLVK